MLREMLRAIEMCVGFGPAELLVGQVCWDRFVLLVGCFMRRSQQYGCSLMIYAY